MRRHRRATALTAAVYVAAATVAATTLVLPWLYGDPQPTAGDVAAGWALLGAACASVRRRPLAGCTLLVAGTLWVAVGVTPQFEGRLADATAHLALAPTALLVIAVGWFVGDTSRRSGLVVAIPATAIAALGAVGMHRYAMAAFGACLLVPLLAAKVAPHRTPRPPEVVGTAAPATWVGVGLVAVGLSNGLDLTGAAFVTNLHQLIMVTGAALVALHIVETQAIVSGDPVSGALTTALGDALGSDLVAIAFPSDAPGVDHPDAFMEWLDPAGGYISLPAGGEFVRTDDDIPIAWLTPPLDRAQRTDELQRLLAVAGTVARLRAELRARAAEITDSIERLQTAGERERARLAMVLEDGPIATLDAAAQVLATQRVDPRLLDRLVTAKRALRDVADGMEPIRDVGQLAEAVRQLTDRFDATCEIDINGDLDPTTARLLWFTCAEGLANAAKHSPGSPVQVELRVADGSFELNVVDHGVGGADIAGDGLAGLHDRAAQSGANLTVDSPVGGGTRLSLRSGADTCYPQPGYSPATMTRGRQLETIEP